MGSRRQGHAVFICYRREDAPAYAALIYEALNRKGLFEGRVFMDVDELEPGRRFPEALRRALDSCDVLIALMGRRWLELIEAAKHPGGAERDYVLMEIKSALDRGVGVLPVLVDGARMPGETELPDGLKALADVQSLELTTSRRAYDMGRLVEAVKKEVAEASRARGLARMSWRHLWRSLRRPLRRAVSPLASERPALMILLTLLTLCVPDALIVWGSTYWVALRYYRGGSPQYLATRPEVLSQLAAVQALLVSAYSIVWMGLVRPKLRRSAGRRRPTRTPTASKTSTPRK